MTPVAAIEPNEPLEAYASVSRDGSPVSGPVSFRLSVDNQPGPAHLVPAEKPADVVFVVENGALASWYRNDIEAAMQAFMNHAPEGNWYALVTFARGVEVTADFTHDKEKIVNAYDSAAQSGRSDISTFDAAYRVLNDTKRIHGRRVIIFIGSGLDRYSERSLGDVQKALEASDATVYAIGTGALLRQPYGSYTFPGMHLETMQARGILETLAGDSGGKAWFPNSDSGFADAMAGVFDDMAAQYRLIYDGQIPADGKLHKIKLEAFAADETSEFAYKVRVRKGWRAG